LLKNLFGTACSMLTKRFVCLPRRRKSMKRLVFFVNFFFCNFRHSDAPPCLAARSFWRCFSEEANYSKAPASWQGFCSENRIFLQNWSDQFATHDNSPGAITTLTGRSIHPHGHPARSARSNRDNNLQPKRTNAFGHQAAPIAHHNG
jgi:hypothetical protein